jgi:hypothetical protein
MAGNGSNAARAIGTENDLGVAAARATGKSRTSMRLAGYILGGAVTGFLYYRFVGCRSGACPITSSPIISTLYGAMLGLLLGGRG